MSVTIGIYGLFSTETNECLYVGQSLNIERRIIDHILQLKKQIHIRDEFNAWFLNKDLKENTIHSKILEILPDRGIDMNNAEIYWFDKLKPKFYGKRPSANDAWENSKETSEKISIGNKTRGKYDDEVLDLYRKGYSMPEISDIVPRSIPGIMKILNRHGEKTNERGYLSNRALNALKPKIETKTCLYCKKEFDVYKSTKRFKTCTQECSANLRRENYKRKLSVEDISHDVFEDYKSGHTKKDIMYKFNISYNFLNKCIDYEKNNQN